MTEKKKKVNKATWVKGVLRRASLAWPARTECIRLARVERGLYKCAMCGELFKQKEIQVDHINPVIDAVDGFTGWDDYINSLFCEIDNLAAVCRVCHESKTAMEVQMRKMARARRKEQELDEEI